MATKDRLRLVLHGAIVLLIGQLCGLPTAVEAMGGDAVRLWHTAHEALIMIGVWMVAASSVLTVIVLGATERSALFWSLLAMGYGFTAALVLGGINGVSPFSPGHTPASFVAFLAATVGILGAVLASALVVMGARAALKDPTVKQAVS
jgi:hypothetical protein